MRIEHHNVKEYGKWFERLGPVAKATVAAEVELLAARWPIGMPRVRNLRDGMYELRIMAHGLRLYFTTTQDQITFLAYGRKDTQTRDIERARTRLT